MCFHVQGLFLCPKPASAEVASTEPSGKTPADRKATSAEAGSGSCCHHSPWEAPALPLHLTTAVTPSASPFTPKGMTALKRVDFFSAFGLWRAALSQEECCEAAGSGPAWWCLPNRNWTKLLWGNETIYLMIWGFGPELAGLGDQQGLCHLDSLTGCCLGWLIRQEAGLQQQWYPPATLPGLMGALCQRRSISPGLRCTRKPRPRWQRVNTWGSLFSIIYDRTPTAGEGQ